MGERLSREPQGGNDILFGISETEMETGVPVVGKHETGEVVTATSQISSSSSEIARLSVQDAQQCPCPDLSHQCQKGSLIIETVVYTSESESVDRTQDIRTMATGTFTKLSTSSRSFSSRLAVDVSRSPTRQTFFDPPRSPRSPMHNEEPTMLTKSLRRKRRLPAVIMPAQVAVLPLDAEPDLSNDSNVTSSSPRTSCPPSSSIPITQWQKRNHVRNYSQPHTAHLGQPAKPYYTAIRKNMSPPSSPPTSRPTSMSLTSNGSPTIDSAGILSAASLPPTLNQGGYGEPRFDLNNIHLFPPPIAKEDELSAVVSPVRESFGRPFSLIAPRTAPGYSVTGETEMRMGLSHQLDPNNAHYSRPKKNRNSWRRSLTSMFRKSINI